MKMLLIISITILLVIACTTKSKEKSKFPYYYSISISDGSNDFKTIFCPNDSAAVDTTLSVFYSKMLVYEKIKSKGSKRAAIPKPISWELVDGSGNNLKTKFGEKYIDSVEQIFLKIKTQIKEDF